MASRGGPFLVASTGLFPPLPGEPDNSAPPGPSSGGREFSFKVQTHTATAVPSSFKFWLNQASATVFAIDGKRSGAVARITPGADGSLFLDPARYAAGQSLLVSF